MKADLTLEGRVGSCGPGESGAGGPSSQVDSGSSDPGEYMWFVSLIIVMFWYD